MALNFPSQPQTIGSIYEAPNGINYTWDGVKWVAAGASGAGGANLGNLYVIDQTIAGINEDKPIILTGNITSTGNVTAYSVHTRTGAGNGGGFTFIDPLDGNETSGMQHFNSDNSVGFIHTGNIGLRVYSNGRVSTNKIVSDLELLANLKIGNSTLSQIDNELQVNNYPLHVFGNIKSSGNVVTSNIDLNGAQLTAEAGTLYVDGVAVGGAGFASELVAGNYNVTLYPNGNTVIPGTISSTAAGIPEFNSSTDLNLNAANRVNIVNSPLNLGAVIPNTVIGKPGDIIYHPALQEIQAYINGAWENLLRTAENQNVRLPQGGAYQRSDGVRAAWFTELPTDISQLTDNNNLLTSQLITLQNIDIDGGGAYSIYEIGLLFADGGFGSSRFGPSDTVFDGAGAGSGYTNSLNGGGA